MTTTLGLQVTENAIHIALKRSKGNIVEVGNFQVCYGDGPSFDIHPMGITGWLTVNNAREAALYIAGFEQARRILKG